MQTALPIDTDAGSSVTPQPSQGRQENAKKDVASNPRLSLHARVTWSIVANTARALTQAGYLFVFAQIGSLEMAGQYALGIAVTAPIFMFLNLGLRQLQGTDTNREFDFGDYLGLRILTTGLGILLVSAVVVLMGCPWVTSLIILVVAGSRSIEAVADTFYGLFQQRERNDLIAISQGIKSVASLGTLALVLWITESVFDALVAAALARLMLFFVCDLPWSRAIECLKPKLNINNIKRLRSVAVPLGLVAMFLSLSANIPRYFIATYQGERALGIYAVVELFLQLVLVVTISIQQATSARMARSYIEGGDKFRRHLSFLLVAGVAWGALATLAAYGCGNWVLAVFLGDESTSYHGALTLLVSATIAINLRCFLGATMVIMRHTRTQAFVTAASTVATLALAWLLIPQFSITGAAWTTLLSGIVFSVLTATAILFHHKCDQTSCKTKLSAKNRNQSPEHALP